MMVTFPTAWTVASLTVEAVMLTVLVDATDGAVYKPDDVMFPWLADQFTRSSLALETVAENCCCAPECSDTVNGDNETVGGTEDLKLLLAESPAQPSMQRETGTTANRERKKGQ